MAKAVPALQQATEHALQGELKIHRESLADRRLLHGFPDGGAKIHRRVAAIEEELAHRRALADNVSQAMQASFGGRGTADTRVTTFRCYPTAYISTLCLFGI